MTMTFGEKDNGWKVQVFSRSVIYCYSRIFPLSKKQPTQLTANVLRTFWQHSLNVCNTQGKVYAF